MRIADDASSSDDIVAVRAALATEKARADVLALRAEHAEAELAHAKTRLSVKDAEIERLKLEIKKAKREQYGQSSERGARLIDQLELQLEELEASATEDEVAADLAALKLDPDKPPRQRRHPVKKPFPAHLPRERVVVPAPTSCTCCGSSRLSKLGEDITETLETIPRQFKVIQTVREKFTCRDCEKISQPPAPFHVIPRGHIGPSLLAMILYDKFALHQPLNRQSDEFLREGIELALSTLADHVGAGTVSLRPLYALLEAHVFSAERLHSDDTPVPLLAKGKTITARLWTNVRDDAPFGGAAPPAAVYYFSRDQHGEHPQKQLANFTGILQADAYGGYRELYAAERSPGPIYEAACWVHGRRGFYVLADIIRAARDDKYVISPVALEAVKRIDAMFAIEAQIRGMDAEVRRAMRHKHIKPLVDAFYAWGQAQLAELGPKKPVAAAFKYMFRRWDSFTRFLDDGRICMSNNAAERTIRGVALGRRAWLFAGSERGGDRAAMMYSLITTARLNKVDAKTWLADVLARIADCPIQQLPDLLPWNWRAERAAAAA
jgi:transposase